MSERKTYRMQDYLDYLRGKVSGAERHEMERKLEADPFEQEAMEGMESIPAAELEEDLHRLHARLNQRLAPQDTGSGRGRRRRIAWYSIAASIASILIVGSIFLKIYDHEVPTELEMQEEMALQQEDERLPMAEEKAEKIPEEPSVPILVAETENEEVEDIVVQEAKPRRQEKAEAATVAEEAAPESEPLTEEAALKEAAPKAAQAVPDTRMRKSEKARLMAMRPEADMPPSYTVDGVVLFSDDLEPLPGATVMVKHSDSGVSADLDGRFTLPLPHDTATLVVAFIGMETGEYSVLAGEETELVMNASHAQLDEVVMVRSKSSDFEDMNDTYTVAEPVQGYRAYRRYVKQNLRIPDDGSEMKQVVIINFMLTAEGKYEQFIAVRSPGPAYTEEAIRLIKEGPAWKVAENMDGPMDELVRMRIVFKK